MRNVQPPAAKMMRRCAKKRRYRQNRKIVDDFEDPVLEPKTPTSRCPIDWEEGWDGEDTPVFAPIYAYTSADLLPYKQYPRLLAERRCIERPIGYTFCFLDLSAELHVQIYRLSLRCKHPIKPSSLQKMEIDKRDEVAACLLRTCKQVHREAGEVFYGENDFRFVDENDRFNVLWQLPIPARRWLKGLTIPVPFLDDHFEFDRSALDDVTFVPRDRRVITSATVRVDRLANRLVRDTLDAVADAPCLRQLNIVIPQGWSPNVFGGPRRTFSWASEGSNLEAYMHVPDVWQDLAALVYHRPSLKISIIRLYDPDDLQHTKDQQERLISKFRHRLSVWDRRVIQPDDHGGSWTRPTECTQKGPSDMFMGFPLLFEEDN